MAWGEWMVPKPGPEHLLTLEQQRRVITSYSVEQARDMLWRLCQLAMHQDLIIRGATKRIAELELTIELGAPLAACAQEAPTADTTAPQAQVLAEELESDPVPWPIRLLRQVIASKAD